MRPALAAATKKTATTPSTTVVAPSRLRAEEIAKDAQRRPHGPAGHAAKRMSPAPKRSPTTQQILPNSSFSASRRSSPLPTPSLIWPCLSLRPFFIGSFSGRNVVLFEREIQRPVPALVYPPGHLLLLGAVLARHLRRLGVAGLLR